MKRWVTRCAAGMCIAGMVAAVPGVASAEVPDAGEGSVSFSASENMNYALYGPPPGSYNPIDEAPQLLYGPPSMFGKQVNTMSVTSKKAVSTKASRLAEGAKVFRKTVFVRDAQGDVKFSKIAKGSSKRLSVNKKSGAIKVKKGTKKGTYRIFVAIRAMGNDKYYPAYEEASVTVRVR